MPIEILDMAPPKALHCLRQARLRAGRSQQMNVVRHEHIGMNGKIVAFSGIEQALFEELAVFVVAENRVTVASCCLPSLMMHVTAHVANCAVSYRKVIAIQNNLPSFTLRFLITNHIIAPGVIGNCVMKLVH
jgi:hypothetical protein